MDLAENQSRLELQYYGVNRRSGVRFQQSGEEESNMKKWIWLVLALPVILSGCDLFNRDFSRAVDATGSLVLVLDGSTIPTRTIAPPNMTAFQYDIELTQGTTTITQLDWTSAAFTKNGLAPGVWTIRVTVEDSTGADIGAILGSTAGTDTATVVVGTVVAKTVNVIPLTGTGGLSLTITWPVGVMTSPVTVGAWLVPEGAAGQYTTYPITFTVDQGNRTATYNVALSPGIATGYHTLLLQLAGSGGPTEAVGWAESVRIVSGVITTGTVSLQTGTGGLGLTVSVDMRNPITINWSTPSTPPTSITQGGNVTITASPAQAAASGYAFSYQWYLEGAPLTTETSAGLTYGPTYTDPALAVGEYTMCVVVTEKQTAAPNAIRTVSSNGFTFRVVP
jgi:hypothetical protein